MISSLIKKNIEAIGAKIVTYILSTYGEHYADEENNVQMIDYWQSLGTLDSTARDNAIKYLSRYGKKDGKNPKDLLKAIHYIVMILVLDHGFGVDEKKEL